MDFRLLYIEDQQPNQWSLSYAQYYVTIIIMSGKRRPAKVCVTTKYFQSNITKVLYYPTMLKTNED